MSDVTTGITMDGFDELTDFKDGEDEQYLVEYILADDGGFCHRASPFLMLKGAIFEHNYGTYKVISIDRKPKHIIVHCERMSSAHPLFDMLLKLREDFN